MDEITEAVTLATSEEADAAQTAAETVQKAQVASDEMQVDPVQSEMETVFRVENLSVVELGRQGEGFARRVLIDVSGFLSQIPDAAAATVEIAAIRPGENVVYLPEAVTMEPNGVLCWCPTLADTTKDGWGRAEVRVKQGETVLKSPKFRTHIEASLGDAETAAVQSAAEAITASSPVAVATVQSTGNESNAPKPSDEDRGAVYHVEALDAVKLGRQGESKTQQVQIDVSGWTQDNMPGATFMVAATRPGESEAYLPTVSVSGNILTWTITGADTAKDGWGRAEVRAEKAGMIRKSPVFRTFIAPSLEGNSAVPVEKPSWVQEIVESVGKAQRAAETAQQAAASAADSVSTLHGWRFTEEADGTVTIEHNEQ